MHTVERQRDQLAMAGIDHLPEPDLGWLRTKKSSPLGRGLGGTAQGSASDSSWNGCGGEGPCPTHPIGTVTQPPHPGPLPEGEGEASAILIPGAAPHRPRKRWPAERFGALATHPRPARPRHHRGHRSRRTVCCRHDLPPLSPLRSTSPAAPPCCNSPKPWRPPPWPSATTPALPTSQRRLVCPPSPCSPPTATRRSPGPGAATSRCIAVPDLADLTVAEGCRLPCRRSMSHQPADLEAL